MARPRKLTPLQLEKAARDKRKGMTWKALSIKYKCAINTLRSSLSEYSNEFIPFDTIKKSELEKRLIATERTLNNIKRKLKKRFNLHIE